MKKSLLLVIATFCFVCFSAFSQSTKTVINDHQTWMGYFNQTRVTDKWGWWFDIGYRRNADFFDKDFQFLIRPGLTYFVSTDLRVSAGYAYFKHYPGITKRTVAQPEHRSWQQVLWNQRYSGFSARHAVRLEQRYRRKFADNDHLAEGYSYNNRIRYHLAFFIPLIGKESEVNSLNFIAGDEIMVNFGKEVIYNYFDQNRLYTGLGYQLSSSMNVNLLYINIFQQLASGNSFNNAHVLRLTLLHNLDLRTKEE